MRALRALIPTPIKNVLRRWRDDRTKARLFGPLASMVPDANDMYEGPSSYAEFHANGLEFLELYKSICSLQPDERMLDIGSGLGRKTLPLTGYFDARARYDGMDVSAQGVDWCTRTITPRFPNFRFQRIDVFNLLYNPQGVVQPADYRFPFPDAHFSFVMLGSVFTHMFPADVRRYLLEIGRVLEPGGRAFISFFLSNEESRHLVEAGNSTLAFGPMHDGWSTVNPSLPESAIALDEPMIRHFLGEAGLAIERLDRGSWCGRSAYLSYQDLVLARKAR